MAEGEKQQLSEEERIARKARLFRIISNILIVVAVIVITVFVIFLWGTKQNIDTQTSIDTNALRSKLKQIVSLEIRYHKEHGEYARIHFLQMCKPIPQYIPEVDGDFKYKFDPTTGIATGMERDASHDVNGDNDGNDGLTLSVNWEPGVIEGREGGDFFWTEEELTDFISRAANAQ